MRLVLLLIPMLLNASEFDHKPWDDLLKRYVNERSRVNYAEWRRNGAADLDRYLAQFEAAWRQPSAAEESAALINLYNAHTIRWILQHYPVESIWRTPKAFRVARHRVDGRLVSLDDIETRLRLARDPRVHAVLVCAARSCPPLRREAYLAQIVDQQLSDNTRLWLADESLNTFDAGRRVAEVSSIFKWYRTDFPSLETFLAQYGPERAAFLGSPGSTVRFKDYAWGLNDTTDLGRNYSGMRFYWDYLRNK